MAGADLRARRALRPPPGWSAFSPDRDSARRRTIPILQPVPVMPPNGLEAVYLANRDKLVRFLRARGAGDGAEDLVHDLWLRVSGQPAGPVGNPLAYLFRAADLLMIDRYRSRRQAERREQAWEESRTGDAAAEPDAERQMVARQETARVEQLLRTLGPRKESIFRRARIDGVPQRRIAEELGISISTVESDLRIACHALARLKEDMA